MVEKLGGTASVLRHGRPRVIALGVVAIVAFATLLAFGLPSGPSAVPSVPPAHTDMRTIDAVPASSVVDSAPVIAATVPVPSTTTTTSPPTTSRPTTSRPTTSPTITSSPTTSSMTTSPTNPMVATHQVPVATAQVTTPGGPTITALVAEVEAAGIEPGSNWSWTRSEEHTS